MRKYIGDILIIVFLSIICPVELDEGLEVKIAHLPKNNTVERQIEAKKEVVGIGSWYDYRINGIQISKSMATCASRRFKRGSSLVVTNISNGKSVICRVNDYIAHPGREIDLSSFAFAQIAPLSQGLARVMIKESKR